MSKKKISLSQQIVEDEIRKSGLGVIPKIYKDIALNAAERLLMFKREVEELMFKREVEELRWKYNCSLNEIKKLNNKLKEGKKNE